MGNCLTIRMTDNRENTCPAIETLCRRYGGITKIPFVAALKALDALEWDILISRVGRSVSDRMTDQTPLIVGGHLTSAGRSFIMELQYKRL